MNNPASLWYVHPGFLAGVVIGIVNFAMGVAYGFALARKRGRA